MAFITRVTRLRQAIEKNPDKIIVTERSVFTDREIFAKMLHDAGKIEEIEYSIYLKWFDELVGSIKVDGIIYVKTEPDVCYSRVIKRARQGEHIPLEYLQECHKYHEKWLSKSDVEVLINPSEDRIQSWFQSRV